MRKIVVVLLSLVMLISISACDKAVENMQISEPIKLTNKMTETELSRVEKHTLTLFDDPTEKEHKVSVVYSTVSLDELFAQLENNRDMISDEEYQIAFQEIEKMIEEGDYAYPIHALIDGVWYNDIIPSEDYDGGELAFTVTQSNFTSDDTGNAQPEKVVCSNFEEYLLWAKQRYINDGFSESETDSKLRQIEIVFDAVKSGNYEKISIDNIDPDDVSFYGDPLADYRNTWEYNRTAVEEIKDYIDEISIYDEELDTEFLVHVTLPPDYDENKTYPVFFLTDGVWRFGNHPQMRKVIENGEAAEIILVSLGYGYNTDGADVNIRNSYLVWQRDKLLDFITDNLMPYLGENYNIDYANSTLYGHSDGGVFTHNALFKSDLYENQPFGNYIIGSPAFWGLYGNSEMDTEDYQNDYGYFERNETLDKKVFLCGGSLEDPDYEDKYNGNDSTLEGLAKLNERLKSYNADVTYKLYESHHYQYIPDMLIEFLKTTYPKKAL